MNKENIKQTNREPNIELLRALSMFMIVLSHSLGHTDVVDNSVNPGNTVICYNTFAVWIINMILCSHVDIFVLITGYFMTSKTFTTRRLLKVWSQTFFYGILLTIILYFINLEVYPFSKIGDYLTPITSNKYWFVTKYFGLLIIAPFLSFATKDLSRSNYHILFFALSWLSLEIFFDSKGDAIFALGGALNFNLGFSFPWFVVLFLIGSYLRKFDLPKSFYRLRNYLLVVIIFALLFFLKDTARNILTQSFIYKQPSAFYNGLGIVLALILFSWFKNHKFRQNAFTSLIVKIAPLTFGVYLIHEHEYVKDFLWHRIYDWTTFSNSPLLIPVLLGFSLIVFFTCIFVEYVRTKLFKILGIDRLINRIATWCDRIIFEKIIPKL